MKAAGTLAGPLGQDEVWREMRLHMEWNEGLSLCFLFAPDARATAAIRQWTSDAWAFKTAPLLEVEPQNAVDAATGILQQLQHQAVQFRTVRAPVWVQLTAIDDTTQSGWESARAELLSRLNEAREWLVKSFARPLVVCMPPAWRGKVATVAPDLWHIRSYSAQLAPANGGDAERPPDSQRNQCLQSVTQGQLALAQPELDAARIRQANQPADPALQRELSMALGNWGDANTDMGHGSEALAAYRESLDIRRQLRQALGDTPQVLDDIAVSQERLAQLDTLPTKDRIEAMQEALALRERLVAATKQSQYYIKRLQGARGLAQRLNLGITEAPPSAPAASTSDPAAR